MLFPLDVYRRVWHNGLWVKLWDLGVRGRLLKGYMRLLGVQYC